jgi:NhaP-type Na+/H+ or K+/H+ antiporter
MRIVLATGLFAIGVELPRAYMLKHAKGLAALVIPTMAIGWVVVASRFFCCHFFLSHLSLIHFKAFCLAYFLS